MTENEINFKIAAWHAAGYVFYGNGSENDEADPNTCPSCGGEEIFWALWDHHTLRGDDGWPCAKMTFLCMECGERWVDES